MSKEFEGIVLKELKSINKKLDNLETGLENNNKELAEVKVGLENTNKELLKLKVGLEDTNKKLSNIDMELKDTQEVVRYLNNSFTKFDYEINRKIDTLFDSDTVNKDSIVSLNTKTFNHDTRISNLENKDLKLIKL